MLFSCDNLCFLLACYVGGGPPWWVGGPGWVALRGVGLRLCEWVGPGGWMGGSVGRSPGSLVGRWVGGKTHLKNREPFLATITKALQTVWWDLDLLRNELRAKCNRLQKRCHWLAEFNRRAEEDTSRHRRFPNLFHNLFASQRKYTFLIILNSSFKDC